MPGVVKMIHLGGGKKTSMTSIRFIFDPKNKKINSGGKTKQNKKKACVISDAGAECYHNADHSDATSCLLNTSILCKVTSTSSFNPYSIL